jgi:multidrug efflux pump subunit AcrA (membrane-fusion protein)
VSVSVRLALPKAPGVVAVPLTAIFENQGRKVAYVLEEGNPVRREVTVGAIDANDAEIQSGIREGEDVLLVEPPEPSKNASKKSKS